MLADSVRLRASATEPSTSNPNSRAQQAADHGLERWVRRDQVRELVKVLVERLAIANPEDGRDEAPSGCVTGHASPTVCTPAMTNEAESTSPTRTVAQLLAKRARASGLPVSEDARTARWGAEVADGHGRDGHAGVLGDRWLRVLRGEGRGARGEGRGARGENAETPTPPLRADVWASLMSRDSPGVSLRATLASDGHDFSRCSLRSRSRR